MNLVQSDAYMCLDYYLDKDVYFKFLPDLHINGGKWFEWAYNGEPYAMCDYRVGCALCETGYAYGILTNIGELMKKGYSNPSEWLKLNDVRLFHNNMIKSVRYWETSDQQTIAKIRDMYSDGLFRGNERDKSECGITSAFIKRDYTVHDASQVKNIHVCMDCIKMLDTLKQVNVSAFTETTSHLKYFFFNSVVTFYLKGSIVYKDEQDIHLFSDKILLEDNHIYGWCCP